MLQYFIEFCAIVDDQWVKIDRGRRKVFRLCRVGVEVGKAGRCHTGDNSGERTVGIVFCAAYANVSAGAPSTESGTKSQSASVVRGSRDCPALVGTDAVVVVASAIGPGVVVALVGVKIVPGDVIKRCKAVEVLGGRVVAGVLDVGLLLRRR